MWTIFENVLFLYFMFRFCTLHFETSEPEPQPQSYFKRMNGLLKMEMIASHLNFSIFFFGQTLERNVIISIRILENILVPRYINCFTSQFSSVKLTFPFTKTFLIFAHTHNTNLINCIRRKRKFSPLPFCNVKWITLTVIEFPINIKQFYILFQSLRAQSCSKMNKWKYVWKSILNIWTGVLWWHHHFHIRNDWWNSFEYWWFDKVFFRSESHHERAYLCFNIRFTLLLFCKSKHFVMWNSKTRICKQQRYTNEKG